MINEIFLMNGYGTYVWSAFSFTLISFGSLFLVTRLQLLKEHEKFVFKYNKLNVVKAKVARAQNINKEILTSTLTSKI